MPNSPNSCGDDLFGAKPETPPVRLAIYSCREELDPLNWNLTMNARKCVWAASLFLYLGCASAEEKKDAKEVAVIEIGAVPSRNLKNRTSSLGPTVAVEISPIENWLELEAGVTPSIGNHTTEWATDLLFKKPWTLSKRAEFMIGAGPEWIHANESGAVSNSAGVEAALDFMFWPGGKHRFGWYLEPGYDYSFGRGHEQSVGISGGLLIAIP